MKVCPKCGQSFADGFTFCPKDAARLEKYDLRARVQQQDDLHFLLESDSLVSRLKREMASAVAELMANPRAFLKGLLRGEGSTRQRKRLLQAGLATAVIAYASVMMTARLIGLFEPEHPVNASEEKPSGDFIFILPEISTKAERVKEAAKSGAGLLGGSLPQPKRAHGGGAGNDQKRASRGVEPVASLNPQQMQPDFDPPKIPNATLIIRPSVYVDPNSMRHMKGLIGTSDGPPDAPSRGKGPGTGIGDGDGPGYGKGKNGNTGGDDNTIGGSHRTGTGNDVYAMGPNLRPTILYREKAKYTEEARQNKIQGAVILSVVFSSDGNIRNIRTVRGLPFGLTETSIEAARRIRFQPAIKDGKAVSVSGTLEFNFALY